MVIIGNYSTDAVGFMNLGNRERPRHHFLLCLFADADVISSQLVENPIKSVIFLRTSIRLYLDFSSILICILTQLAMEQSPSTAPMFSGDVRRFSGLVWKWTRCVYNVAPLSDEDGNYKSVSHWTFQNKTSVFHADKIMGGNLIGGCWNFICLFVLNI